MTRETDALCSARHWLTAMAARRPTALALSAGTESATFGELAAAVRSLAARLPTAGARRGGRAALLMSPSRRFVEVIHALQMVGCASVPLNDRSSDAELAVQLEHCDPSLVLFDADHGETAARVCGDSSARRRPRLDAAAGLDRLAATEEVCERIDLSALHSIIYTSGANGQPKAVMLSNENHLASAVAVASRLALSAADRWLAPLPLYHVGGLSIILRSVLVGFSVDLHAGFDAAAVDTALGSGDVSVVSLVPTMLARLLDRAGSGQCRLYPRSLRCVLVGGGAIGAMLADRATRLGVPLVATYGLTEAASQVATAGLREDAGSCGRPLAGVDVRIADADAGGWGEIYVRGASISPGYFRDVRMTREALHDGWLATGDLGRVDASGRLHVACRRSDLIVTGGEIVSVLEVEEVLERHGAVAEAAVYGVDDDEWGQRVEATIVPRDGQSPSDGDLESWCRGLLAGYKVPRRFSRAAELPRTATGKLQRARLIVAGSPPPPE